MRGSSKRAGPPASKTRTATPWLLLIHQIPAAPAYLRVKVGRRLARVGAAQLKGSVYVLPSTDICHEDFSWIRREISDGGGDASIFEASSIEGLTSADLERLFRDARAADYKTWFEMVQGIEKRSGAKLGKSERQALLVELARAEEQIAEIERIDFFPRGEADAARAKVADLRSRFEQPKATRASPVRQTLGAADFQRKVWVTRAGAKVDRLACGWLIRRFIDEGARFKFVDPDAYLHKKGEWRFDMPEAEFTHERDLCSFEVLCMRFALTKPAGLVRIAELVHDLDIKDGRYGHPETEGLRILVEGLVAQHARDQARLDAACLLFDALLAGANGKATSKRKT